MAINPEEFGVSFQGFLEQMSAHRKPAEAPFFVRKLQDHFGSEPATLPILSESFAKHDHPNLHLAIEDYLARDGRSAEVMGVVGLHAFMGQGLSDLIAPSPGYGSPPAEGPVQYANLTLGDNQVVACIERGLFLIKAGEQRLAVFMRDEAKLRMQGGYVVDVMAHDRAVAERFLHELREAMRARNVYRGQVISLREGDMRELIVGFHRLPAVDRASIILPEGLLERIERQTVGFGRQSRRLLAAGRHLKRGILLHGPPGTGKTLTIMYLAGAMRDRTALLLTGRGLGLVGRTCAMARALEPSIVVLEDVDLIAEERTRGGSGCATPLLFELLNEMDGLAEDTDVLFLLTTNRPDLLEPALASRPGRVDQAIEIPAPDENCRRRLFALYGRGLSLQVADLDRFITRTQGASGAFIRELLRRAALFAADGDGEVVVSDRDLDEALHDLVIQGGELTKSLLGFQSSLGFGAPNRNL
jgi:hypothetical protein